MHPTNQDRRNTNLQAKLLWLKITLIGGFLAVCLILLAPPAFGGAISMQAHLGIVSAVGAVPLAAGAGIVTSISDQDT